ncbi:MAG TPA: tRNA (adenosine(37)-N6)-threonylcarbamoyltransferase complex dimerization subunit type 1 TsaB [Thermoanaerobaculia bacterium]|nr:tRNA (adenosine(37)-N6)-threonylcarbamoyltransferase complex dimerization subunit type 1 TsaB [Thermoanaerobaculia bacterium]
MSTEPTLFAGRLLLALDTGSPRLSVAAAVRGETAAVRSGAQQASRSLTLLIDEVLCELGASVREVDGIVALAGPGSFTGLRVGLATALGLAEALGCPATTVPTLQALAAAAPARPGERVLAAVDALRGEWFVQPFAAGPCSAGEGPAEQGPPERVSAAALEAMAAERFVGFGLPALLAGRAGRVLEPGSLAPVALRLAFAAPQVWDSLLLTRPLYLREPQVTLAPVTRTTARSQP